MRTYLLLPQQLTLRFLFVFFFFCLLLLLTFDGSYAREAVRKTARKRGKTVSPRQSEARSTIQKPSWREWEEPWAPHEDVDDIGNLRLLDDEEHEGVATDIVPNSAEIEADWEHDYDILREVLTSRNIDVSGATTLCELPAVYCASGYRRRVPNYASTLMGDWVGEQYQLILPIEDESIANVVNDSLFDLKRVGYFTIEVNSGVMPSGIPKLPLQAVLSIAGTWTEGLQGALPDDFWSFKARMFVLRGMGSHFTGSLPVTLPFCEYLDYRLYMYNMDGFTGDVGALAQCTKVTNVVSITALLNLGGNAWTALLGQTNLNGLAIYARSQFSGSIPHASWAGDPDDDPWRHWCLASTRSVSLEIDQTVGGPLPVGLEACSNIFTELKLAHSSLTGPFPIDFTNSSTLTAEGLDVEDNEFTGPLPNIPSTTTSVNVKNNRWSGDIPESWHLATGLTTMDLTNCLMTGSLPNITANTIAVKFSGNRFTGLIPDSWATALLNSIDLRTNLLAGPPLKWGWMGADPTGNYLQLEIPAVWLEPPPWPLEVVKLDNNPFAISVGFFMGLFSYYDVVELHCSNCSLTGTVQNGDLVPVELLAGGGTGLRGGSSYTLLEVLDLSGNDIIHFGWSTQDEDPLPSFCWNTPLLTHFPEMSKLLLSDNPRLRLVHSGIYSFNYVDLSNCPMLKGPEVLPNRSACDGTFGSQDELCSTSDVVACLYLTTIWSEASTGMVCGELGVVLEDGSRPTLLADSQPFDSEALCKCIAGYFHADDDEGCCSPCSTNTYRSEEMEMESCAICPNASTTVQGSPATSVGDCQCQAGQFMSNGICELCPEDTYSAVEGATSIRSCVECPHGTVTSSKGAQSLTLCVCPAGSTAINNSTLCNECLRGTFKSQLGGASCTSCSELNISLPAGYSLTTLSVGESDSAACVCPEGTYVPTEDASACWLCPEGMTCPDANASEANILANDLAAYPHVAPGYMTRIGDSRLMKPFKCKVADWCPGGRPGTCALGRDANTIGCGLCPAGRFSTTSDECQTCDGLAEPFLLCGASLVGLCLLTVVALMVNNETATEANSTTLILIVTSLTFMAVQSLGILASLSVIWPEPVRAIMAIVSMLSFDLEVLRIDCLVGQSVVIGYLLRQLLVPGGCIWIAVVVWAKRKFPRPTMDLWTHTLNAVGAAYQACFVSILLSISLPFVCYSHPQNGGASMRSEPSVMCFESSEHSMLIVVSVLSLLLNIFPYLGLVCYALSHYRAALADSSRSYNYLTLFRFLFFRFRPERFYYSAVALLRSCLLCLVPILAHDRGAAQVLMATSLFLTFLVWQLLDQPWRNATGNHIDAVVSSLLLLLLTCAAMSGSLDDSDVTIGVFATLVVAFLFLCCLGSLCQGLYKRLVPAPYFARFICHHKAEAAAQARYLQMSLSHRTGESCFLDSDHLSNLDNLLDIVRCRIGCLLVYLTTDTLHRPWCAAEISMAYLTHRRVRPIRTPSFADPTEDDLLPEKMDTFIHGSGVRFAEAGISLSAISKAMQWLLALTTTRITLNVEAVGLERIQRIVDEVISSANRYTLGGSLMTSVSSRAKSGMGSTDTTGSNNGYHKEKLDSGMVVIASLPNSDEATAAAGILGHLLQAKVMTFVRKGVCILANATADHEDLIEETVRQARAVLIVLSEGSLRSPEQIATIMHSTSSTTSQVIPVLTPDFKFPTGKYYEALAVVQHGSEVSKSIRAFFKRIAIPLATHSSLSVLEAQVEDIVTRIPKTQPDSKKDSRDRVSNLLSIDQIRGLTVQLSYLVAQLESDSRGSTMVQHKGSSGQNTNWARSWGTSYSTASEGIGGIGLVGKSHGATTTSQAQMQTQSQSQSQSQALDSGVASQEMEQLQQLQQFLKQQRLRWQQQRQQQQQQEQDGRSEFVEGSEPENDEEIGNNTFSDVPDTVLHDNV